MKKTFICALCRSELVIIDEHEVNLFCDDCEGKINRIYESIVEDAQEPTIMDYEKLAEQLNNNKKATRKLIADCIEYY